MAIYNEILAGRFNRMLQKITGIKGPPPVPQLAGEVQPVLNLFSGVESRFLDQTYRWAAGLAFPAVAAQTVGLRLRNPVGSAIIAVVEKIAISSASVQEIDIGIGTTAVDLSIGTPTTLDGRQVQVGSNIIQSTSIASPGAPSPPIQRVQAINQNIEVISDEDQEIVIAPATFLQVTSTVVNTAVVFNVWWRERILEESERQ